MKTVTSLLVSLLLLSSAAGLAQAETLGQRAVYTMNVLPAGDPAQVGQCSAFAFGDISDGGGGCLGGFSDNSVTTAPTLTGGDGIAGDGLAGTFTIETDRIDPATGNNTFTITAFQMDPYLGTPGGTFKTTMTPPDGALNGGGSVSAAGAMTLDVTGRVGVAQFFEGTIGIQPWNQDNSAQPALAGLVTGLYEPFTTGDNNNWDPGTGASNLTLTGRPIGDANTDSILDAVLVSVGNVGAAWGAFDGTPYSEAFNVQFELVSAKPVAVADLLDGSPVTPLTIIVATDLLANDLHADPAESISLMSFTQPTGPGSSIVDNMDGTLTYNPPDPGVTTDTFTYSITDNAGETDTANVTINLVSGGPPLCNNVIASTDEDTPLILDPTISCTDPDGDPLTVISFDPVSVAGGAVVSAGGNDLAYTPPSNFFSPPDDSFGFSVTDLDGNIASAVVIVTVIPVDDPLICEDVSLITDIDTPLSIDVANDLLSTCIDVEGSALSLVMVQTPTDQGGNVSDDGAGTLIYTPPAGFEGEDTFTYTATDGVHTDTRTITVTVGADFGNFTMLDASGNLFGGTNDVLFDWDGTVNTDETDTNFNMAIASATPWPFFGFIWTAHDIRVFGPGAYSFDSGCTVSEIRVTGCPTGSAANSGPPVRMTVGPDQLGVHMLFDWNQSVNIDIVNVWNRNDVWDTYGDEPPKNELYTGLAGPSPDPDTLWALVSTDVNGDGIHGAPMVDGPFRGYYANFNASPGQPDTDGDGIVDSADNCTLVANPAQRDTDNDGYGNYCDPDFNGDLVVNAGDLAYMKSVFLTPDPDADLNGDGSVNAGDLAILKTFFFGPPGPSGIIP